MIWFEDNGECEDWGTSDGDGGNVLEVGVLVSIFNSCSPLATSSKLAEVDDMKRRIHTWWFLFSWAW